MLDFFSKVYYSIYGHRDSVPYPHPLLCKNPSRNVSTLCKMLAALPIFRDLLQFFAYDAKAAIEKGDV